MSLTVTARDNRCRISGRGDELKNAHIIPKGELNWFNLNEMDEYNANPTLPSDQRTQDVRNGILLREDIRSALDNKIFVVVPKLSKPVVHFLSPTRDLGMLFHNAIVEMPPGMRREFWYARLAFNIFEHVPKTSSLHERMPIVSRQGGIRVVGMREPLSPPRSCSGTKRPACSSQRSEMPPPKKSKDGEEANSTVELSYSTSDEEIEPAVEPSFLDEETEYQHELQRQRERFPSMSQEHEHTDDVVWNTINWYPGQKRFYRKVQQYMTDHPSVKAVAEPEKAVWDDPEYHQ